MTCQCTSACPAAQADPTLDPLLGTEAVARLLRVSIRTVAKLVDQGHFGHRLPGSKNRRILRSELVRYIGSAKLPPEWAEEAAKIERAVRPRRRRAQG
jgi:excisionase family DNA binding protein